MVGWGMTTTPTVAWEDPTTRESVSRMLRRYCWFLLYTVVAGLGVGLVTANIEASLASAWFYLLVFPVAVGVGGAYAAWCVAYLIWFSNARRTLKQNPWVPYQAEYDVKVFLNGLLLHTANPNQESVHQIAFGPHRHCFAPKGASVPILGAGTARKKVVANVNRTVIGRAIGYPDGSAPAQKIRGHFGWTR